MSDIPKNDRYLIGDRVEVKYVGTVRYVGSNYVELEVDRRDGSTGITRVDRNAGTFTILSQEGK